MTEYDKLSIIVDKAIQTFNEQERYLLERNLSERCICARFAMHLTNALQRTEYSEYYVDVEYNRGNAGHEWRAKTMNGKLIVVDLIVHKRRYDNNYGFDNLICIEMKKSTNKRGCKDDESRLETMVNQSNGFCYKVGFMILADMKQFVLRKKQSFSQGSLEQKAEITISGTSDFDRCFEFI